MAHDPRAPLLDMLAAIERARVMIESIDESQFMCDMRSHSW